jgi:hypothetical protein
VQAVEAMARPGEKFAHHAAEFGIVVNQKQ